MKNSNSKLTFLITGGAGFIGSNLCEYLAERDYNLIVIDDLSSGNLDNLNSIIDKITFYESSIENFNFDIIKKVDIVIHLAAQTSVPFSIENFYNSSKTNLISSLKVLEFCKTKQTPIVYASSSAVYGNLEKGNDKSDLVDILSPYSADKYALEIYAKMLFSLFKVPSFGLRFFNVYGPRQDPNSIYSGVISIFLKNMKNNQPITINGGFQTRDFIYVQDVVKFIFKSSIILQDKNICETVNILSNKSISIDYLSKLIMKIFGSKNEILIKSLPEGDPEKSDGTFEKMSRIFDIKENEITDIEEGLNKTIKYFNEL